MLPHSPTEMSTVFELLQRSVAIANWIGQQSVLVTLDQAIYSKANEIIWRHPAQFSNVVLLLGCFHTSVIFLSIIGQRFADAELHDILVESGLTGSNVVSSVLSGKHYNRAMRVHQVVMEALFRLLWRSFEQWLSEEEALGRILSARLKNALECFRQGFRQESFHALKSSPDFNALYQAFYHFCSSMQSPVAKLWLSYLCMVQLLLSYTRSI